MHMSIKQRERHPVRIAVVSQKLSPVQVGISEASGGGVDDRKHYCCHVLFVDCIVR